MSSVISAKLATLLQDVSVQLRPDDGDFVGRDFARAEIADFLSVHNRMLVFVGSPGVGKTALAAALVREQVEGDAPYLAHFCELRGADNPYAFCNALAQQLQAQLGDDYSLPQTARGQQVNVSTSVSVGQASGDTRITALELKIGGMHPREAFRQVVREPLCAYDVAHGAKRGGKPLIIVIDAIDRAWDWDAGQGGNIVSVLADVQDLPPWVNLICTARPGPAVQALRAQAGVRVFDIQAQSQENLADIERFFNECFLSRLDDEMRGRFDSLLSASLNGEPGDRRALFVRRAVEASQGSFLFVRRYVDAWWALLRSGSAQPTVDPATLLRFDAGGSLADTLDTTYAAIAAQIRSVVDANAGDADEDVLAVLAVAFAPLTLPLLVRMMGRGTDVILDSLGRLAPVIERGMVGDEQTYALYHRGFADFVRRQLPLTGRTWDVRIAQVLELPDDGNARIRDYSANYRWSHLLRGLDLAEAARSAMPDQQSDVPDVAVPRDWFDGITQVQSQVRDAVTQSQLLRGLAARALDPAQSDAIGSWSAAINCLRVAERTLRRSRALVYLSDRRGRIRGFKTIPPELIELERTLIALGDVYATIARRMDAGGHRPSRPVGFTGRMHAFWDGIARFPLTLYLLLVLIFQGVRDLHIPGALENLGRGQDWTVARLCVLSVSAYRRAKQLALARGAAEMVDDIVERLAGLYQQMGAYDAAAASYSMLLSQPNAIERPWRQAVWRLALGEVLLAMRRTDRTVEVLTGALPIFVAQEAPVQEARALTALATAHHRQAAQAERQGDGAMAATLNDLSIANCRDALQAWQRVKTLQGDESVSVDPALAVSFIAHQLWRATRDRHLSDEQQRAAFALLDTIPERHYPQRFEHPLLRLFRIAALVFLPASVLTGLLLGVQRPSTIQVRTRTELALQAPLADFASYPNNLIDDTLISPSALSVSDLLQLAAGSNQVRFQTSAPSLDPLAISWVMVFFVVIYLAIYTVFGVVVISFSSPAQFQNRRPGRVILRHDRLVWRGPAGQGSLLEAWGWLWEDIRSMAFLGLRRVRRVLGYPPTERYRRVLRSYEETLMLSDISGIIDMDRRALGYLLYDFSSTMLQTGGQASGTVVLPGTLMHYEELGSELERLAKVPVRPFGVEIVRSRGGVCFLVTLVYALVLVGLVPLLPVDAGEQVLTFRYWLTNLYIVAAPGMIMPLLWWFVAQPLGASSLRRWSVLPLAATALLGLGLTMAVFGGLVSLTGIGLRPDLATPVVASGLMLTLVFYAPPRPLHRFFVVSWGMFVRGVLLVVGLVGLVSLVWYIGTTLLWYNALVRGNQEVERALSVYCEGYGGCRVPDEAIDYYNQVICLRPNDSDGYAFRGFARLVRGEYNAARSDFQAALFVGQPNARPAPLGCSTTAATPPNDAQRLSLYANIGSVDTLHARQLSLAGAEPYYQRALCSYGVALRLVSAEVCVDGSPTAASLSCYPLMLQVIVPSDVAATAVFDPLAPDAVAVDAAQAPFVLQLADACYSRGFARLQSLGQVRGAMMTSAHQLAWDDLAAAVAGYGAVLQSSTSEQDVDFAGHGLAASWAALSQFDVPPVGTVEQHTYDRTTALLRSLSVYQMLDRTGHADLDVYVGQAWCAIQLGATDAATEPLAQLESLVPDDPTYPAFRGLVAWLSGTQYPQPSRSVPSPGYAKGLRDAIDFYTSALKTGKVDVPRAYATRSLLYFSLRNSPRGAVYVDEDYATWLRLAISDIDQAINEAEHAGLTVAQSTPYRYWRGRLYFTLAITLQEKFRGPYAWSQLVPLYSGAFDDFRSAAVSDPVSNRREKYEAFWMPWAHVLLLNATHMQAAEEFAQRGDFVRARSELALVEPLPAVVARWEGSSRSAPLPDFSFLHGLIGLGLGEQPHSANPLLGTGTITATDVLAEASYEEAIREVGDARVMPSLDAGTLMVVRRRLYDEALADLKHLLAAPPAGWPARSRAAAERVLARLQQQRDLLK